MLQKMAKGLMERYSNLNVEPPKVLYVDRGCCTTSATTSTSTRKLFSDWEKQIIRLDIWHFMRRIASGCSSESRPLYGRFMTALTAAVFEWEIQDLQALYEAKRAELAKNGINTDPLASMDKYVTKNDLAKHCRRQIRQPDQIADEIPSLIEKYKSANDSTGTPLFCPEIEAIWENASAGASMTL